MNRLIFVCLLIIASAVCFPTQAQQPQCAMEKPAPRRKFYPIPAAGTKQQGTLGVTVTGRLEITEAILFARTRWSKDYSAGSTTQLQYAGKLSGLVRADRGNKLTFHFTVSSGNSFRDSWNSTGIGAGPQASKHLFARQLFVEYSPSKFAQIQAGSLGIERGLASEATHYDEDGFVVGERLTLRQPKRLFFDQVTVTRGYLGDFDKPNAFARFPRMSGSNYSQVLVTKRLSKQVAVGAELSSLNHVETARQAMLVEMPWGIVVDKVRLEMYETSGATGFGITAGKSLSSKVDVYAGVSSVDKGWGRVNGDQFGDGRRVFAGSSWRVSEQTSVQTFFTHAYGRSVFENRNGLQVSLKVDVLGLIKRQ